MFTNVANLDNFDQQACFPDFVAFGVAVSHVNGTLHCKRDPTNQQKFIIRGFGPIASGTVLKVKMYQSIININRLVTITTY